MKQALENTALKAFVLPQWKWSWGVSHEDVPMFEIAKGRSRSIKTLGSHSRPGLPGQWVQNSEVLRANQAPWRLR